MDQKPSDQATTNASLRTRAWAPLSPRRLLSKDSASGTPLVTTSGERAYPGALREAELDCLKHRWKAAGFDRQTAQVGLAISGGGIRSATFALGVLQALAGAKGVAGRSLLRGVDFLSTVSGGGYIGAFLGALISRQALDGPSGAGAKQTGIERAESVLTDPDSDAVQWLRENGRYMSPNGAGDELLALSSYLRNWVAIQVILATMVLAVCAALQWLRPTADALLARVVPGSGEALIHSHFWWSPYIALPIATFLVLALPLGWAFWYERVRLGGPASAFFPWLAQFFVLAVALLPRWLALPAGFLGVWSWASHHRIPDALVAVSALSIAAWVAGAIAFLPHRSTWVHLRTRFMRNWLTRMLALSLTLTAALFAIALIDSLGQTAYAWFKVRGDATVGWLGGTGLAMFVALGRSAVGWLSGKASGGAATPRWRVPIGVLAGLGALIVFGLLFVTLSAASHAVAWGGKVPLGNPWAVVSPQGSPSGSLPVVVGADGHAVVQYESPPLPSEAADIARRRYTEAAAALCLLATAFSVLFGPGVAFINRSSLQGLYSARLTRAYLGASNRVRRQQPNISDAAPGDDLDMNTYAPHQGGGPLHLLNVTVNETVGGESQIEHRDRKGLGMAVGPAGLSVGVRHHALWKGTTGAVAPIWWYEQGSDGRLALHPRYHMLAKNLAEPAVEQRDYKDADHNVEAVSLGDWVAISGAAFSTGLGARTSLGLSALLGFLNVRLGYWWNSDVRPGERAGGARRGLGERLAELLNFVFPVQTHLLQEFRARFHGPHRQRWYLTDGGHFENAACYELIRRRLPLILCCDDGQDGGYDFEDLANLVRKARTDFRTDIRFLDEKELDDLQLGGLRKAVGTLDDLRPRADGARWSKAHAALAKVTYPDAGEAPAAPAYLLVLKPSLRGDESLDVQQYRASHLSFPQESTIDQYFDEAQWESYRRLGEHIGERLFGEQAGDWLRSKLHAGAGSPA